MPTKSFIRHPIMQPGLHSTSRGPHRPGHGQRNKSSHATFEGTERKAAAVVIINVCLRSAVGVACTSVAALKKRTHMARAKNI